MPCRAMPCIAEWQVIPEWTGASQCWSVISVINLLWSHDTVGFRESATWRVEACPWLLGCTFTSVRICWRKFRCDGVTLICAVTARKKEARPIWFLCCNTLDVRNSLAVDLLDLDLIPRQPDVHQNFRQPKLTPTSWSNVDVVIAESLTWVKASEELFNTRRIYSHLDLPWFTWWILMTCFKFFSVLQRCSAESTSLLATSTGTSAELQNALRSGLGAPS